MKQKGFTLIELLIVIAILGILAVVIILNIGTFSNIASNGATNETAVTNTTMFSDLAARPISSLNATELDFMIEYCLRRSTHYIGTSEWLDKATIYQNQIIINELKEQP